MLASIWANVLVEVYVEQLMSMVLGRHQMSRILALAEDVGRLAKVNRTQSPRKAVFEAFY